MKNFESSLGQLYRRTYKVLCGQSPYERPRHFQWLSTLLVILFLNWIDTALSSTGVTKLLKDIFIPILIPVSLVLNLFGLAFDQLDRTNMFYSNVLLFERKR